MPHAQSGYNRCGSAAAKKNFRQLNLENGIEIHPTAMPLALQAIVV
jgi:hypothetical protein